MSNPRRNALHALAIAAALALPLPSLAAFDAFLKINGIDGESNDDVHKGEIVVESWAFGASAAVTTGSAARTTSKACLSDLSLVKQVDKATPPLLGAAMLGAIIPKAVLTIRRKGTQQQEFLVVTMSDVIVTSVREGGSSSDALYEQVTLSAGSMLVAYKAQAADGSLQPAVQTTVSGRC